jgi:hypothetical protein
MEPGYEAITTAALKQPALRPLHCGARIQKVQARLPRVPRAPGDLAGLF